MKKIFLLSILFLSSIFVKAQLSQGEAMNNQKFSKEITEWKNRSK
jgi:hypothetical protein